MFLPAGHMHSKPAALLGHPEEIWSGLSCFCEGKVVPQRVSPRMTLATGGNMCLQCPGWRAAERRENHCRGCVACVTATVRDSSYLLGPVSILHACDWCESTLGCGNGVQDCSCCPICAEFLKCLKMSKPTWGSRQVYFVNLVRLMLREVEGYCWILFECVLFRIALVFSYVLWKSDVKMPAFSLCLLFPQILICQCYSKFGFWVGQKCQWRKKFCLTFKHSCVCMHVLTCVSNLSIFEILLTMNCQELFFWCLE